MTRRRSDMDSSFAPSGLGHSLSAAHGLRPFGRLWAGCGLHSFAASRLNWFGQWVLAALCIGILSVGAWAQGGGELRFCLRAEPKTFDPLKVEDDASVSIRYLTGGVLVRQAD